MQVLNERLMLFEGRIYRQKSGDQDNLFRFADTGGGVATTAYRWAFSETEIKERYAKIPAICTQ
jgi:hypothetical protein